MSIQCGGMTRNFFTNRDGMAIIEHASVGRARVYVNGKAYGTFHAPIVMEWRL